MSGSRPAQLAQGTYAKHSIAHDSCFPCRNHQIIRVRHHSFPLSNRSSGSGSKSSKATWSLQHGYGAIQILVPWRTIGLYGCVPSWIPKTQPQELRKMLKQKNHTQQAMKICIWTYPDSATRLLGSMRGNRHGLKRLRPELPRAKGITSGEHLYTIWLEGSTSMRQLFWFEQKGIWKIGPLLVNSNLFHP